MFIFATVKYTHTNNKKHSSLTIENIFETFNIFFYNEKICDAFDGAINWCPALLSDQSDWCRH